MAMAANSVRAPEVLLQVLASRLAMADTLGEPVHRFGR